MVDLRAGETGDIGKRDVGAPDGRPHAGPTDSSGFSYVEVLVAVVLVGVTVITMIVGLRATVIAGRVGSERSQLLLWVQEGTQAVHRTPYVPCGPKRMMSDPEVDAIKGGYQTALDGVAPPDGMAGGTLVVTDIDFLSVDPVTFTERWDHYECDPTFSVALLRLAATSPENTTIGQEVIIDG